MDFLFFILVIFLSISSSSPVSAAISSVYPNSTASGTFLFSSNGKFKAAMFSPGEQRARFYCSVIHVESNTVIWSANRDSPVSESGRVVLTVDGITLIDAKDGSSKWSTPRFQSSVFALHLTDAGNLVLLDRSNTTLWESFRHPTDTIVTGQTLHLSTVLLSAVSIDDLSTGDYKLALTSSDVTLDWKSLVYWKLSMDTKAYVKSNYAVEYMVVNQTGLYLFGQNGSTVVISVSLPPSDFRFAKIDVSGRFIVDGSFLGAGQKLDLFGPVDQCHVPSTCGKLGLCNCGVSKDTFACSCPLGFRLASDNTTNCVPENSSHSLSVNSCNSNSTDADSLTPVVSYLQLSYDVDYFANSFNPPVAFGVNISWCQDLCSRDCACSGIFYDNSSGSCYKLENELGSFMSKTTSNGRLGFIKTLVRPTNHDGYNNSGADVSFPGAKVVLPLISVLFVFVTGILLWKRFRRVTSKRKTNTDNHDNGKMTMIRSHSYSSSCDDDLMKISIPGLPLRFSYEELMIATANFKTEIGTGGYGTVYKGFMSDKTVVAVKRLTRLGHQGKKDFCAEIAAIGNIHHVNLVKLRGYCADHRKEWLLVYEYMSHGSLDKTLFVGCNDKGPPVLEWQERVEIAIGTARGLAYLHDGCEPKVVHCDVKPENILLGGGERRRLVKISDFGLSKFVGLGESSVMATMRGTRGYLAPEWLTRSTISDKTDVYSFGMVLLEMVSGRKNCLPSSEDEIVFFPLHALEMHEQGRYLELVDPRLRDRVVNGEDVERMVRVALCCVHQEPRLRPSMVNVVGMLEGGIALDEPRVESLTFLGFYGRRSRFPRVELAADDDDVSRHSNSSSESVVSYAVFSNVSSHQMSGPR